MSDLSDADRQPWLTGGVSRRTALKMAGVGALSAVSAPILAACTGNGRSNSSATVSDGATSFRLRSATFGSSASDPLPKKAIADTIIAFEIKSGAQVSVTTFEHNALQNNINSYLTRNPDDAFMWFAGYRMRYYAAKGLVAPIDDVWEQLAGHYPKAIADASTGDDGRKYFVPNYNYPWAIFYSTSLWAVEGYEVPKTFDSFRKLCAQMRKDGITPIAFGDKEGWPAMGTFDYLNMRLNGFPFHIDLMAHKESWDQPKVRNVFDYWKAILPYHASGATNRTWQQAADTLAAKTTGMFLLGSFVTEQLDAITVDDLDFFPFPMLTEANGQDALEAPIDGFMLSNRGGGNPVARDLLAFLGSAEGQDAYQRIDNANLPTNDQADTSKFTRLQRKAQQTIANAKQISQFLDRDALPALANDVIAPALQHFVQTGSFDTKQVEAQAKQLYAAQ